MAKLKLNKLAVFSCVPATSTGASRTPPYSNERDTDGDEKLCSVCTEHLSTLDNLRPGSRRLSHTGRFLIHKEISLPCLPCPLKENRAQDNSV